MCETMRKIIDREHYDADIKARMDAALNLWSEGSMILIRFRKAQNYQ